MSIIKIIDRIRYMDYLIQQESTGNPKQFARKLGLSRSMLYENLEELKTLGAPIRYSRKKKTFYYRSGFQMRIDFIEHELDPRELHAISERTKRGHPGGTDRSG